MTRPAGRLRRPARAAVGLGALATLLTGPPYALVHFTGWPVPHHLPGWTQLEAFLASPLSDGAIIGGLALAAWVLWAMAAAAVLIEAVAAVAGYHAPRLPVLAPFQAVAAAIIGATVLATLQIQQAAPRPAPPLQAALTASTAVAGPLIPGQPPTAAAARAPHATGSQDAHAARPRVYRVVPGDDLWEIAARFLGNGERWHELFRLNAGKPQPDGRTLTDPNLIYPGWILLLSPPGGTTAPGPPTSTPGGPPQRAHPPPRPPGRGSGMAPGARRLRPRPAGTSTPTQ